MKTDHCLWTQDSDGVWQTKCDNSFEVTNGLPSENGFKFCVYCGKPLLEQKYDEDDA